MVWVVEGESTEERLNRELIELLNELRVALPGVQVLFAFLLAVPFTNRYAALGELDRAVFFVAFIATALATAFLIAPSSYHRLRWRERDKERMLAFSNTLTIAGLALLALAVVATVFFVTDFVFDELAATIASSVVASVFVVLWYGLPLASALAGRRS